MIKIAMSDDENLKNSSDSKSWRQKDSESYKKNRRGYLMKKKIELSELWRRPLNE